MTVHTLRLPPAVAEELAKNKRFAFDRMRVPEDAYPWHSYPAQELYVADLDQCVAGRAVTSAYLVGWQVIVVSSDGATRFVHVGIASGAPTFDGINEGPFVASTLGALKSAPLVAPDDRSYVARVLRIPSIYLMALWLHHEPDTTLDLIIPLEPTTYGLSQDKVMSRRDFEDAVREPAQVRSAQLSV